MDHKTPVTVALIYRRMVFLPVFPSARGQPDREATSVITRPNIR
jgi:hypothetical protein